MIISYFDITNIKFNLKYFKTLIILFFITLISCQQTDYYRLEKNYGKKLEELALEFNLPSEYLKSLIILESSGKKKVPSRFEKHVYKKLIALREGKISKYETLKSHHLKNASDAAIKNLASSWGPFQLMGYKCLDLGIKVSDIRGDNALFWGVYWINKEYGDYLRNNKFEEAFRIHNTGSPYGKTYHSHYVSNGLKHIEYFKK